LLAVACYEKCLSDVIRKYQPNISSIVKPSNKAGKKPNQSVRKRRARSDDRDVSQYSDPLDDGNLSIPPPSEQWNVVFVKDTKMRKLYGCGGNVRQNLNFEPPSPWNIVLTRREYRTFTPRGTNSLRISTKKENVYYHPRKRCLQEKNASVSGNSVKVAPEIGNKLDDLHKNQLRKEFGINV